MYLVALAAAVLAASAFTAANAQYVVGEPMDEPEPQAEPYSEMTSHALDVVDVMDRGGFVLSAASTGNLRRDPNVTRRNVTYPGLTAGTQFRVDVTSVRVPVAPPNGSAPFQIRKNYSIVDVDVSRLSRNAIAVTELFVDELNAPRAVEVPADCLLRHKGFSSSKHLDQAGDEWRYFMAGKIGALSLHTLRTAREANATDAGDLSDVELQPINGSVTYKICLKNRYLPIFKSVAAVPGRMVDWRWVCVKWDQSHHKWDTESCYVRDNNDNTTFKTCRCDGGSSNSYTMLLGIKNQVAITRVVMAFCLTFESVSVVSLLVAVTILLCVRKSLKSSVEECRSKTDMFNHTNLCAALGLLHFCALMQPLAVRDERTCKVLAVMIHYFLLVSAAWMLKEGLHLYRNTCSKTIQVAETSKRWIHASFRILLPWGAPALFVGFCFGLSLITDCYMSSSKNYDLMINFRRFAKPSENETAKLPEYTKYSVCWLSPSMTYAVAVPIMVMLLPNVAIAILVATRVWKIKKLDRTRHNLSVRNNSLPSSQDRPSVSGTSQASTSRATDLKPILASFRAFLILLPVLGVPWIGLIAGVVPRAETHITILHLLTSSLQGLLVTCVVCLINRDVRKALLRCSNAKRRRAGMASTSMTSHSV